MGVAIKNYYYIDYQIINEYLRKCDFKSKEWNKPAMTE